VTTALALASVAVVTAREAFRVDSGEVARLVTGVAGAQADVLADGIVTNDEYTATVMQTVACLVDLGVAVSQPQWNGSELRFTYGGYSTRAQLETAAAVYASCSAANQAAVDRVWRRQTTAERPDAEAIADYYELMKSCTGATEPTFRAVVAAAEASGDSSLLERCHLAAADEARIPAR